MLCDDDVAEWLNNLVPSRFFCGLGRSLLIVFMAVQGGVVANPGTAIGIASAKTSLTFVQAFTRGILCNWLVCMAGTITGGAWLQGGVKLNLQLVLAVLCPMTPRRGGYGSCEERLSPFFT